MTSNGKKDQTSKFQESVEIVEDYSGVFLALIVVSGAYVAFWTYRKLSDFTDYALSAFRQA